MSTKDSTSIANANLSSRLPSKQPSRKIQRYSLQHTTSFYRSLSTPFFIVRKLPYCPFKALLLVSDMLFPNPTYLVLCEFFCSLFIHLTPIDCLVIADANKSCVKILFIKIDNCKTVLPIHPTRPSVWDSAVYMSKCTY